MKVYEVYTTDGFDSWAEKFFLKEATAQKYLIKIANDKDNDYLTVKIAEIEVNEE